MYRSVYVIGINRNYIIIAIHEIEMDTIINSDITEVRFGWQPEEQPEWEEIQQLIITKRIYQY